MYTGKKSDLFIITVNAKDNGVMFRMFGRKEGVIQVLSTQPRHCLAEEQWAYFLKSDRNQ